MNMRRYIGAIVAAILATWCSSAPAQPVAYPAITSLSASKNPCTLASTTWTCNPADSAGIYNIGTITLTGNQTINMGANPTPGQFFTIRLTQDGSGSRYPVWCTAIAGTCTGPPFLFENFNNIEGSVGNANTLVPIAVHGTFEHILFQYDDALSKWVYLARSGIQQLASGSQGGGTTIGPHLGNNASVAALALPANEETQVFADNGGFFTGGVYQFVQLQVGVIQVCNFDAVSTLAVFHCDLLSVYSPTVQTAPVLLSSGQCAEFGIDNPAGLWPATQYYGGYSCFVNPGNSAAAYATWNSGYNEEVPGS